MKALFTTLVILASSLTVFAQLSGSYTIGASGDYGTFNEAVEALSTQGVSAAVTFNVESGVYDEQVVIPEITGVSAANNITFQSTTNDSTDVELTYASTNGDSAFVIKFDTTQNITFRYITIHSQSEVYDHNMVVLCNSQDIQFYNCHFAGSLSATDFGYSNSLIVSDEAETNCDNLRIEESYFSHGYRALWLNGKSSAEKTDNLIISGNVFRFQVDKTIDITNYQNATIGNNKIFDDPNTYGIDLESCSIIDISQNIISANPPTGSTLDMSYGINVVYSERVDITRNVVHNYGTYGIYVHGSTDVSTSRPLIANNFISGDGPGLNIYYAHYLDIYHNSIHSTGSCIEVEADEIKAYNNVFNNSSNEYAIQTSSYCNNLDFDYNDYYTEGSLLGTWLGTACADLAELQSVSGQNTNAISSNPEFVADDDLHTNALALNGAALSGLVSVDIDGETRDGTNPDIGADEFEPLTINLAMISVSIPSACDLGPSENVVVKLVNRGTASLSTIPVSYTIDDGATYVNETINQAMNAGDTIEYIFSNTIDMTVPDEYTCIAFTELPGDELHSDDTASITVNSYGSINTFPFYEDFEVNNSYYFKRSANSDAKVFISSSAGNNSGYGLKFDYSSEGGHLWDWVGGDTPDSTQLWVDNAYFHGFATSCNVDVSGMTNPALQFDMKMRVTSSAKKAWFRVLADGATELVDVEGVEEFHVTSTTPFETKVFPLNQLSTDNFELTLQSCIRSSPHIYVDNIIIGEKPIVELGANQITCEGTPIVFDAGAGAGYTYAWFKEGNADTLVKTQTYETDVEGTYFVHVYSGAGIISKDTVSLAVNPSYSFVKDTAICDSETLEWHGQVYDETGTYYDNLLTNEGCDSTFTLNLTVNPTYTYSETYTICDNDSLFWHEEYYKEPGIYYDSLTTMNGCDSVYVLELSNYPTFLDTQISTICSNDSLLWRGSYYNETGIYYDSLESMYGCDSVYMLDLLVNPAYSFYESSTICDNDSLLWRSDYYKTEGTYYDSLKTIDDCDSVFVLDLFVNPTFFSSEAYTICSNDSILWHDNYYSETGFYYDSLSSIDGCDSVIMLDLTVNPAYEFVESTAICDTDSILWRDDYYHVTGVYYDSLTTSLGCDSVYVLDLLVNSTYYTEEIYTICSDDSVLWQDDYYSETGIYYDSLQTTSGCDSIFMLDLTVFEAYHFTESATICENDSVLWRGDYYFDAGTYFDNYTTEHGCDSIYLLDLVVNPTYEYYDEETICNGDSILWRGNYFSEQGDYFDEYTTIWGCDSVYNLSLEVHTIDTSVTVIDNVLTANATGSVMYQWFDCNTGFSVGYNQIFEVTESGSYAVALDQYGCRDTSSCYTIILDGVEQYDAVSGSYHVYPNPANEMVTIEGGAIESIHIQDARGKIVATKNYGGKPKVSLDISSYQPGAYVLQINTGKFIISKLILIE